MKRVLVARPGHPLSSRPTLRQILEYPFVIPTYWTVEGLERGNDQFPIPIGKRKTGDETATADAAVPVVINTDQLAFLPHPLARPFIRRRQLKPLACREIPKVEKDLFLSARADAVPARVFESMAVTLRAAL